MNDVSYHSMRSFTQDVTRRGPHDALLESHQSVMMFVCKDQPWTVGCAGIATGFWTEEWVLNHGDDEDACTRYLPSITSEEAQDRLERWNKAVLLSYNLSNDTK